jgi:hypothetical protein
MPRGKRSAAAGGNRAARVGRRRGRPASAVNDGQLADIVARYVNNLVEAVREVVRRNVVAEVQEALSGRGLSVGRTRRALGKKRVLQCIAPGCTNPSKGPRFHYLCEKHKDAKKADYEAWRKARKEKQAA